MPDPAPDPAPDPPPPQPQSPRPRPEANNDTTPIPPPPQFSFINEPAPPPRSSVQSMFMMMLFFFFMSNGNSPSYTVVDGEVRPRQTELSVLREQVAEYEGWFNGTGNWTEPAVPEYLPQNYVPAKYYHPPQGEHFFPNITGWYRGAKVHTVDLEDGGHDDFFNGVNLPTLGEWNSTLSKELRGTFDWTGVSAWDIKVHERRTAVDLKRDEEELSRREVEWAWVKGKITLRGNASTDYDMFGLHYIPNGTYEAFALPEGVRIDVRHIPTLYPHHHNTTASIVLAELRRELKREEEAFLLTDVNPDYMTETRCPLLIHLSLPPLPEGVTLDQVLQYEQELANPTGILSSLKRPKGYWEGEGLGGVIVADQCGLVFGIDGGHGVPMDNFWRKTVHYATFATLSQLLVLLLLVRQMERTRTPSTLAKVSLWTIVLISASDSAIFSGHIILGLFADNKTSLPLLIPGFMALCTAIVFGPRYAVLLHRVQAPERAITRPEGEDQAWTDRIASTLDTYPVLKWVGTLIILFVLIQLLRFAAVLPFVLFATQSIWIPQIYRNARRGSANGLGHDFIIGTTVGRLALPLYLLACPDNVFFTETADWVYILVLWQAAQVLVLFAQDRFGPAFFLPKSLAPPEGYNYQPVLTSDIESSRETTTCSICMEEVDTRGKNYAVAPCDHLFHTKCLQQWMAIKTVCPLCKRPLPPL